MVLIWQGRGIVIFFIFIAACVAGIALTILWIAPILGIVDDDRAVNLAIAVSTFLSGTATYPFGRYIMKRRPDKSSMDSRTGQPNVHQANDTFCFIDIKYWTHIFMALTAIMLGIVIFS
jgi:hypothetical protein